MRAPAVGADIRNDRQMAASEGPADGRLGKRAKASASQVEDCEQTRRRGSGCDDGGGALETHKQSKIVKFSRRLFVVFKLAFWQFDVCQRAAYKTRRQQPKETDEQKYRDFKILSRRAALSGVVKTNRKKSKNAAKRLHAALKRRLDKIARTRTSQKALRIRPRHDDDDDKPKNGPHKAQARASLCVAPSASRPTAAAADACGERAGERAGGRASERADEWSSASGGRRRGRAHAPLANWVAGGESLVDPKIKNALFAVAAATAASVASASASINGASSPPRVRKRSN